MEITTSINMDSYGLNSHTMARLSFQVLVNCCADANREASIVANIEMAEADLKGVYLFWSNKETQKAPRR
jgi:hypothetical protein